MSLPYSSSTPALYPGELRRTQRSEHATHRVSEKTHECFRAAKYLKRLLELDIKPRLMAFLTIATVVFLNVQQGYLNSQFFLECHCDHYNPRRFHQCCTILIFLSYRPPLKLFIL